MTPLRVLCVLVTGNPYALPRSRATTASATATFAAPRAASTAWAGGAAGAGERDEARRPPDEATVQKKTETLSPIAGQLRAALLDRGGRGDAEDADAA